MPLFILLPDAAPSSHLSCMVGWTEKRKQALDSSGSVFSIRIVPCQNFLPRSLFHSFVRLCSVCRTSLLDTNRTSGFKEEGTRSWLSRITILTLVNLRTLDILLHYWGFQRAFIYITYRYLTTFEIKPDNCRNIFISLKITIMNPLHIKINNILYEKEFFQSKKTKYWEECHYFVFFKSF